MPLSKSFLAELQHESAITRKTLQRIPADKLGWKPHETSVSLATLATHIADIHEWPQFIISSDELDVMQKPIAPIALDTPEAIMERFEQKLKGTIPVLEQAGDEHLDKPWTFRAGEHVLFSMPRKQVLRGMIISHVVHHRGQLTVYLRMLGVPVPSIYGPSADEPF